MITLLSEESIVQIVAAAIAAVATILGVAITAWVSVRNLKKESYNKRVTEERINWLNRVRADYSVIMCAYELKHAGHNNSDPPGIDKNEYDKRMLEAEKAKYDLISRLRESPYPGNEYNPLLKSILLEMRFIPEQDAFDKEKIAKFISYMNFMLEAEWDKCKEETR